MPARKGREAGRRAARLLLELLRPGEPGVGEEVAAEDLREAAALAFRHGLFLLVDRRIRGQLAAFPGETTADEYEKSAHPLRLRHISHAYLSERAEREVLALLEAAAIPTVVLKGSAISRDCYGEPHYRTSADVDLLVRPGDVPAVDAVLRGAGYRCDNDGPLPFWMRRLHHAVYQRPGSPLPVEIHWNFSIPGFFNLGPVEIWDGVDMEGVHGRLRPEMAVTHLLMHHHLHGCTDLRTLVDLVWALERHRDVLDPERMSGRLESAGLLVVAGIARLQAAELWGPDGWGLGPPGASPTLRMRLLVGAAGSVLRPGRRTRRRDRLVHALVHRFGLDSPRRVIGAITKTLLPAAADIRALTGNERGVAAGYVRYFHWRFGGRLAVGARKRRW